MGVPQIDMHRLDPHTAVQRAGINAVRQELAAWSAGKPRRVRQAARCLDGWLEAAERDDPHAKYDGVIVADCVKRAVERLRHAVDDCVVKQNQRRC